MEFQSPIDTNKTLPLSTVWFKSDYVSIPYRYKQNKSKVSKNHSSPTAFQSPIGTNKTNQRSCFRCLGTRVSIPYRYKQNKRRNGALGIKRSVSIPYRYKQNLSAVADYDIPLISKFQSPIGTNKT